ncbi:hypothetical protein E4T56_gene10119 [Termitomyces sp. T112]|nr:hypothetical protein E4T56_gene10119 [Termitomyces sp. T112]
MTSKPTIAIKARSAWELISDYDNRENANEVTITFDFVTSGSYISAMFNEAVASEARKLAESGSVQLESGVSYGPITASTQAGYQMSSEINTMLENTIGEQPEGIVSWDKKVTEGYTVHAYSRLILYQRHFYGPGISVQDSSILLDDVPLNAADAEEEVLINIELEPKSFISGIQVVYGDQASDAPDDRVGDWFGGSDNINYGFDAKFVWLVPVYTTQVSEALTNFDLIIQDQEDSRYNDLAAGTGGNYRYLIPVRQNNQDLFISKLTLVRSASSLDDLFNVTWPGLPQGATGNINAGREGTYLYLSRQLQRAYAL